MKITDALIINRDEIKNELKKKACLFNKFANAAVYLENNADRAERHEHELEGMIRFLRDLCVVYIELDSHPNPNEGEHAVPYQYKTIRIYWTDSDYPVNPDTVVIGENA